MNNQKRTEMLKECLLSYQKRENMYNQTKGGQLVRAILVQWENQFYEKRNFSKFNCALLSEEMKNEFYLADFLFPFLLKNNLVIRNYFSF